MDKKNYLRTIKDSAARFVPSALLVLAFAVGAWLMPRTAQAATVYDDLFDTQGEFIVNLPASGNGDVNVTNFMSEYMSQVDSGTCKTAYDYFLANESNPYFFRTAAQDIQSSSDQKGVIIYFGIMNHTITTDLEFDFDQQGSPSFTRRVRAMQPPNDFTSIYALSINGVVNTTYGTDYSIVCSIPTNISLVFYTPSGGQSGNRRNIIFARGNEGLTVVYNYPVGYEGNENPWENPPNVSEDIPDIKLRGVLDWEGTFSDDNFLSIDQVPFTCEGGLAPVISGELWDDSGSPTMIDTFTANSTALFTIKFDDVALEKDYRIVSWYICDDGLNEFSDAAHYSFTITSYGTLKNQSFFEDCIKDSFPYIDFDACVQNIFKVIEMLHFKEVNVGSGWNTTTGCYTLATVNIWINLNNPVICPAFSGSVRALITPFVVFLLGLSAVHIINRGIGKGEA